MTAKKKLNEEEAIEALQGVFPAHDVTPGVFLQLGLEIEDQQCVYYSFISIPSQLSVSTDSPVPDRRVLRARVVTGKSISELAGQQEKRNVLMRQIASWQAMQDVHMPMVVPLRASPSTSFPAGSPPPLVAASSKAEDVRLWLPSSLPSSLLVDSLAGLRGKEARLRHAQLSDSLDDIRRMRRVLAAVADYNKTNVAGTGQRMTTRMQDLYARFRAKERRAVNRYRAAHAAMHALEPNGDWAITFRSLLDEDLRGPRKQDDDMGEPASEGRYQISWIWLTPGANTDTTNATRPATADEFSISMRTEWARSRARAHRWEEEETLLLEEMRRVVAFFTWRAAWWSDQVGRREGISVRLDHGLAIYARRQAAVFEGLATRCGVRWYTYLKTLGPVPSWIKPYADAALPYRPRRSLTKLLRDCIVHEPLVDAQLSDEESAASEESDSGDSGFDM